MSDENKPTEIEMLRDEKEKAWKEYEKVSIHATAAYRKYKKLNDNLRSKELYEKAKRQVMRDLIKASSKVLDGDTK